MSQEALSPRTDNIFCAQRISVVAHRNIFFLILIGALVSLENEGIAALASARLLIG